MPIRLNVPRVECYQLPSILFRVGTKSDTTSRARLADRARRSVIAPDHESVDCVTMWAPRLHQAHFPSSSTGQLSTTVIGFASELRTGDSIRNCWPLADTT